MNILLAHHLEAHHVPVLLCLFAAGFYIGWHALSRRLTRARGATADPAGKGRTGGPRG